MAYVWLKNGKIVKENGRIPLRNHCPCTPLYNYTQWIYRCTEEGWKLSVENTEFSCRSQKYMEAHKFFGGTEAEVMDQWHYFDDIAYFWTKAEDCNCRYSGDLPEDPEKPLPPEDPPEDERCKYGYCCTVTYELTWSFIVSPNGTGNLYSHATTDIYLNNGVTDRIITAKIVSCSGLGNNDIPPCYIYEESSLPGQARLNMGSVSEGENTASMTIQYKVCATEPFNDTEIGAVVGETRYMIYQLDANGQMIAATCSGATSLRQTESSCDSGNTANTDSTITTLLAELPANLQ